MEVMQPDLEEIFVRIMGGAEDGGAVQSRVVNS